MIILCNGLGHLGNGLVLGVDLLLHQAFLLQSLGFIALDALELLVEFFDLGIQVGGL